MNLNPDHLHHAYLCLGNITEWYQKLHSFFGESVSGMIWINYEYQKLGIDEVRELYDELSQKTNGKFLVITAERFTIEAQQAFLKLMEEPAPNTHIFLIVPPQVYILETIFSRVVTLRSDDSASNTQLFTIKTFLFDSPSKRLDAIESLVKGRDKDESLQAYEVHQFLDQLESALYAVFHKKPNAQFSEYFEAIRDARGWASQTSFPMKNVIEYVAMVLPEFGKK